MAKIVSMADALKKLTLGEPVGMPTETVYGLAAAIDNPDALGKIFTYKKRPLFDPLIIHVLSADQAKSLVKNWSLAAEVLASWFWPGPLTLVMEKSELVSDLITAGLPTVGIRAPAHSVAQELLKKFGKPLAAPSANRFGKTSPTTAEHVLGEFIDLDLAVLDGGASEGGIESTIVALSGEGNSVELTLLRKGLVIPSKIESALAEKNVSVTWASADGGIQAPGQIKHHYMPNVPLIIVKGASDFSTDEILNEVEKRFSELPDVVEGVEIVKPRFPIRSVKEIMLPLEATNAARELYAKLRTESLGAELLLWREPAKLENKLWESILERLYKAASLIITK